MGMEATIIAIGPFNKDLVDVLCYPSDWYEDVEVGETVISTFIQMVTSQGSRDLAKAFGTKADMLGKHVLFPQDCDFSILRETLEPVYGSKETNQKC